MRNYRGLTYNGKLIYGWLVEVQGEPCIVSEPHFSGFTGGEVLHHEIWGFRKVRPETVGQSTGRKDKKCTKEFPEGQEIYGGDIIQWKDQYQQSTWQVVFEMAEFRIKYIRGERTDTPCFKPSWSRNAKVIGNIHQNKDLLND